MTLDWELSQAVSIRDLAGACANFLAYAGDQLPHLRSGDQELASYVGRRLDGSWRWLDWVMGTWVEQRYQLAVPGSERVADVPMAVEAASQSRSLAAPSAGQLNVDAAEHLESVARLIGALVGRSTEQVDVRDAAITMHLARRSFSAYRVAKYRWLEAEMAAGRYQPQEAYRWLEA